MERFKMTGVNSDNLAALETQLQKEGYKSDEPWNSNMRAVGFDCIYAHQDGTYAIQSHGVSNPFNRPEITGEEYLKM